MSAWRLEKAEKRIGELEAERDRLTARVAELEAWREKVREAVGVDSWCCCGYCDGDDE